VTHISHFTELLAFWCILLISDQCLSCIPAWYTRLIRWLCITTSNADFASSNTSWHSFLLSAFSLYVSSTGKAVYINPLLNNLSDSYLGMKIGNVNCNASACADDVALMSIREHETQVMINCLIEDLCRLCIGHCSGYLLVELLELLGIVVIFCYPILLNY
jgi:hypothetical protein